MVQLHDNDEGTRSSRAPVGKKIEAKHGDQVVGVDAANEGPSTESAEKRADRETDRQITLCNGQIFFVKEVRSSL